MPRLVGELDDACAPLLDAAQAVGARVWVVSEYGHCDVTRPVLLNRVLREAGLLDRPARAVRRDPRHLRQPGLRRLRPSARPRLRPPTRRSRPRPRPPRRRARASPASWPARSAREIGLDHPAVGRARRPVRARRLVRLSVLARRPPGPRLRPDGRHPPQAGLRPVRAVLRPRACSGPRGARSRRLVQKKLGFRTLFDVIPLDPTLVRGQPRPAAPRAPRIARS